MNTNLIVEFLTNLLKIDSPTGYTKHAVQYIENVANSLNFKTTKTNKGNLIIHIPGKSEKTVGIATHVDTLGLMVRSINANGTLNFTTLGGITVPTLDSEYVRIITREGKIHTGTIRCNSTSSHVYDDATTKIRKPEEMHIVLDEITPTNQEVKELGIENGDIVCVDPKTTITSSGYIKSRFLDDKASVAVMLYLLQHLKENNIHPTNTIQLIISTYEEVGHGASYIDPEIEELIALDMGCIGKDLSCTEFDVSICPKDSSGPYDYDLTSKLIQIAKKCNLKYAVDIYPYYGSDASAALRGGANIKAALVGPGIANSHGLERTHKESLENTAKLLLEYITM